MMQGLKLVRLLEGRSPYVMTPLMSRLLPVPPSPLSVPSRQKVKQMRNRVARLDPEGVKYHGFTYFPRFQGEVDPPYEPTQLFAVRRIRSVKGLPYWERQIMEQDLKLQERRSVAIVKNTPSRNAVLYKVKHLVEIRPISFPQGLPTEPTNGFLKENGEFVVYNKLGTHGDIGLADVEADVEEVRRRTVDSQTMRKRLHRQWYSRW